MRKVYSFLLFAILLAPFLQAQQPLKDIRRKSHQLFAYRIPADTAEKYIRSGIKQIDHYLAQKPAIVFPADTVDYDKIPVGNYLLLSVKDTMIEAAYYNSTEVFPYLSNDQVQPQLLLRDDKGKTFTDGKVWVNKTPVKMNAASNLFPLGKKPKESDLIRIVVGTDTSFITTYFDDDPNYKLSRQRWWRFRSTRAGKWIAWVPDKVKSIFRNKSGYSKKRRNSGVQGKGYAVFNKPKYFPSDTVKFKAYLMNKKGKQYNKAAAVFLNYRDKNNSVSRKLLDLKPASPGAFVYQFATGDTLPNDTRYTLNFRDKKGRTLLNGQFRIEDYLLDEVATYTVSSIKDTYYRSDTMQFSASAKDANGLSLMDGKVKLLLLAKKVNSFYKRRVFVPDTVWQKEIPLAVEGETKFTIPAGIMPEADAELEAKAIFKNSNNEVQEKTAEVKFFAESSRIDISEEDGMIKAVYYVNGKPTGAKGWMETDITKKPVAVTFPYSGPIDPHAEDYEFETDDAYDWYDVESRYKVSFGRMQHGDTVGFSLYNPKKIPVYYTLYDGDKAVTSATSSEAMINWEGEIPVNKVYYLRWQHYWAGEEVKQNESLALLSKLMSAEIKGADAVYPGQKDTITVKLRDYLKRDAAKVNLTVASYNSQFAADIKVPEPPYIQKFRGREPLLRGTYDTDEVNAKASFSLGKHQGWRKNFGLDSMQYYQLLFPDRNYRMVKSRITTLMPQVSVYAVQNGVPQEIYLLYINRELAYYNGITDKPKYSFSVFPGFTQLAIRLKDKYIEIDSIYLQPYYKHDIVLDIDKKTAYYKVRDTVAYWTDGEKYLLNNRILRVENNSRNNNGYVWQDDKAYYLGSNGEHIAGPFTNYDSIQFYKPGDFDFKFSFEPGYRYRVTPQMVRLEKIPLFSFKDEVKLAAKQASWVLGDTLVDLPEIKYEKKKEALPFLEQTGYNSYGSRLGTSIISLKTPYWAKDTSVSFTILANEKDETDYRVLWGGQSSIYNVGKGKYTVVLVTNHYAYITATGIEVNEQGTYCVKVDKVYTATNEIAERIMIYQRDARLRREQERMRVYREDQYLDSVKLQPSMTLQGGRSGVYGRVVDAKGGDPIPAVSIHLKGYKTGTFTQADGSYRIQNIPSGNYVLQFASVGYGTAERNISVQEGENLMLNVSLQMSSAQMSEVVVTAAFGVKRMAKELGYSVSKVSASDITSTLIGKVSGLNITTQVNSGVFGDTRITLRGIRSLTGDNQPLLVIDGVVTPLKQLSDIDPNLIESTSILKADAAVAIYGAVAANGVLIITTKGFNPKMMREEFRDYAFWQPNLITDENGEAKFTVTYPDNITSWQTWVVGMDKKHRITKASKTVRSFKPLLAQLSAPQFLVEGDTAIAIGKKINYTTSDLDVQVDYTLNGKRQIEATEKLKGNDAAISKLGIIVPPGADTMTARFSIKASNGFADGEQRKLPVLRRGTTETVGEFFILQGDTSVLVKAKENAGEVKLFAQNNTLDLLLEEIDHLNKYPYYCMEQTASKLTGLLMEKKIREALSQPFKNEKMMQQLIDKLRKGQLYEGGWSWWENGRGSNTITNYIVRALLQMRGDDLTESNIRNALLYLFNQLPRLDRYELPETLYTLSEAGHDMDYTIWLKQFKFDSLSLHQQWQVVAVMQKQKLSFEKELQKLMNKKVSTMLGGLHWGEQSYWWNRNAMATTVLAYKTLGRVSGYDTEQKRMVQYFLEQRRNGYWQNTVESASVLSAILPDMLKENQNFNEKASLTISGDTSMSVNKFPFAVKLSDKIDDININKQGGGMVYFTAYQQLFNSNPQVVDSNFRIRSYFKNERTDLSVLKAGEKAIMRVEMEVLKDADYVQIEIPVPAGCTFASKNTGRWSEHREYFRDRVMLFVEKMNKGSYTYEIELEPRYTGTYTLNPAKAELMYFPVFYGRNGVEKVRIE